MARFFSRNRKSFNSGRRQPLRRIGLGIERLEQKATPAVLFFDGMQLDTFDQSHWTATGATVSTLGINEPSAPYSARLNGSPGGGNELRSTTINLAGMTGVELSYYYQRTGGGDSPESGDDLVLQYLNSTGTWVELGRQLGSGADMTTFSQVKHALPAAALHSTFAFRFTSIGTSGTGPFDDWFVDDVLVATVSVSVVPASPDLASSSDSGVSSTDNLTNRDNSSAGKALSFVVGGTVPGATVTIYNSGTAIGSAVATGSSTTVVTNGTSDLADGIRSLTARQTETGKLESGDSPALAITVDTTSPLLPAVGALDTSFGDAGKRLVSFPGNFNDSGNDVAVHDDGRVIASGSVFNGTSSLHTLIRYNADGTLDPSFGTGGIFQTSLSGGGGAIAIQPDGKYVVTGSAAGGMTVLRHMPDGSLDPSFSGDGIATKQVGTSTSNARSLVIQPDGKILAGGISTFGSGSIQYDFAVVRFNADGTIDSTFGTDGAVTVTIGSGGYGIEDIELMDDGRIVAAGSPTGAGVGWPVDSAIVRFLPNGGLDPTFGTGGRRQFLTGGYTDLEAAALLDDGRIIIAGVSNGDFMVARLNVAGSNDPAFGAGGVVTTHLGDLDVAEDVAIDDQGRIVAVGSRFSSPFVFAVARYTPNGSLDAAFGSGGWTTSRIGIGNGSEGARAVAIDSSGRIVTVGSAYNANSFDMAIAVFLGEPVTIDLVDDSDTGASSIDNVTTDETPTLRFSGAPYVRYFRNGVQISGDYEPSGDFTASEQSVGVSVYSARLVDSAGNESALLVPLNITVTLRADYNANEVVDVADHAVWRNSFGSFLSEWPADGNRDGTVDAADYVFWRKNLGMMTAASASASGLSADQSETPCELVLDILQATVIPPAAADGVAEYLATVASAKGFVRTSRIDKPALMAGQQLAAVRYKNSSLLMCLPTREANIWLKSEAQIADDVKRDGPRELSALDCALELLDMQQLISLGCGSHAR
jgi:uncharacterized delta-60 repeat protein